MIPILNQLKYSFNRIYDFYKWCDSFSGLLQIILLTGLILSCLDPRAVKWPLMGSPFPTLTILIVYLSIIKYGPEYMKKKKAFNLRWPLVVYNFSVTGLNAWMAVEVNLLFNPFFEGLTHNGSLLDIQLLSCGLKLNYNFICQLVDMSDNEYEVRVSIIQGQRQ